MLVKDKSALLEDISGHLSSIGIGSQGSDQCSRAEVFGPVKALVLVKNKGISDEGDRDIRYQLLSVGRVRTNKLST